MYYCDHNHLNCPGHGGESGGFSYQTQSAAMWDNIRAQGRLFIIMSDRNPILDDLLQGGHPDPLTPSASHGSLGQNHLRDDGRNGLVSKAADFAVALDADVVVMENARELIRAVGEKQGATIAGYAFIGLPPPCRNVRQIDKKN